MKINCIFMDLLTISHKTLPYFFLHWFKPMVSLRHHACEVCSGCWRPCDSAAPFGRCLAGEWGVTCPRCPSAQPGPEQTPFNWKSVLANQWWWFLVYLLGTFIAIEHASKVTLGIPVMMVINRHQTKMNRGCHNGWFRGGNLLNVKPTTYDPSTTGPSSMCSVGFGKLKVYSIL